jgi:hypothetical protein
LIKLNGVLTSSDYHQRSLKTLFGIVNLFIYIRILKISANDLPRDKRPFI